MSSLLLYLMIIAISVMLASNRNFSEAPSLSDYREILLDLGNHSSIRYLNRSVLSKGFFNEAAISLNDEAVYIVLSNTRTASSRVISIFTGNIFNHVSISLDYALKTAVSYNGGNKRYYPGLNPERIEDLIITEQSSALIYRLPVSREQKKEIIRRIKEIDVEGSSYNILGFILNKSFKPNIMYCSQFVYSLLNDAGLQYFIAENEKIKPADFIELDYRRKLTFCYEL